MTLHDRISTKLFPEARLLQKLNRSTEALEAYDCLLAQNPESLDYYRGYFLANGIDLSMCEKLVSE